MPQVDADGIDGVGRSRATRMRMIATATPATADAQEDRRRQSGVLATRPESNAQPDRGAGDERIAPAAVTPPTSSAWRRTSIQFDRERGREDH
jgi:hypothetical protein